MKKLYLVIDGNSLMHRAFHAVPDTLTAADGTPTNAVFGFLSMLIKLIETSKPDAIVCAFDAGKPAFRTQALPTYKSKRPPMDDSLRSQFPIMEDILHSLNIPVVKIKDWEGDDIIGSVARMCEASGNLAYLATGDKDAYQLITDNVKIITTKHRSSEVIIIGHDEVVERFGVSPNQIIDFIGLKGDPSDEIPGVPGIGEKTASKILNDFGSIEGVYENLDKFKGKQLENLSNNKDLAQLSRTVATIVTDVNVGLDLDCVSWPSFDAYRVKSVFSGYNLYKHMHAFCAFSNAEIGEEQELVTIDLPDTASGDQALGLLNAYWKASSDKYISCAIERNEQSGLFQSDLSLGFAVDGKIGYLDGQDAHDAYKKIIKCCKFITLDAKDFLKYALPADVTENSLISESELIASCYFDVGIASYIIDSSFNKYSIIELFEKYCDAQLSEELAAILHDSPSDAQAHEGARLAAISYLLSFLQKELSSRLKSQNQLEIFEAIDIPASKVLTLMERTGCAIDVNSLRAVSERTAGEMQFLQEEIFAKAGENFNINSSKELAVILFEKLGLPHGKKLKSGYSTDKSVLNDIAKLHPLPALVLKYRELAKIKSTYLDALPAHTACDGRVHSTFNQTSVATGRLSSSNPNLQNIPRMKDVAGVNSEAASAQVLHEAPDSQAGSVFGSESGCEPSSGDSALQIRECFVPLDTESVFLSADYSQIELRILAHLANDESLIAGFEGGGGFSHKHGC